MMHVTTDSSSQPNVFNLYRYSFGQDGTHVSILKHMYEECFRCLQKIKKYMCSAIKERVGDFV
jgi:hypothetical protein